MKSYLELVNVLNKHNNGSDVILQNKSEDSFNFFDLFDVLVWKLDLKNNSFNLISSDFGYKNISTCDFKKFLLNIKPCFQDYFINYFKKYYQFLFENKLQLNEYRLQGFIPVKLKKESYTLSVICIIPIINNQRVEGFYFTLTPLKKYCDQCPSFSILKERNEDKLLTYRINNSVTIGEQLTKKQSEVFDLILRGYTSAKIAQKLNKNRETVLDYNIRIKEKFISFFEIDFDSVIDAANYYKKCFLSN